MSDTTGAVPSASDNAAGGTPAESDLPAMQGLEDSVDDPTDPTASERDAPDQTIADLVESASGSGDESSSDPMPDISGTTSG